MSDISKAIAYIKAVEANVGPPTLVLPADDMPVFRPFSTDLAVSYVLDEGTHFRFVNQREQREQGLNDEELHQLGVHNLTRLASASDLRIQPYGSIFAVLMGGHFEASLILVDVLWNQAFRQIVTGDYAAALPARDLLAICDRESQAGRNDLEQMISRSRGKVDHPLTDRIYVRSDGKWMPDVN